MSTPNENYQEHQTHNSVEIHQSGHTVGRHNGADVAIVIVGAVLVLAIVALLVFGVLALAWFAVEVLR